MLAASAKAANDLRQERGISQGAALNSPRSKLADRTSCRNAVAQPRRSVRQSVRRCSRGLLFGNRGGRFHRDGRTPALDAGSRADGFVAASTSKDGTETSGAGATPSCSSSMSRPRWRPVTGPASSAGAPMRGLSRRRSPAGLPCPRTRSIACCTQERLDGRAKRGHGRALEGLPDGSVVASRASRAALGRPRPARCNGHPADTTEAHARPRNLMVNVLTPPGTLAALARGYRPRWHPSADAESL